MRANPCAGRGACAAPAALLPAALPAVAAPVARPVLMPLWMRVAAVIALLIAIAWFAGTLMTTRRDTSRAVADIPMAPADRREWIARVEACSTRFHDGQIDLRALHLELAEILRGFAAARTGEPAESATAQEILRMAGVRLHPLMERPAFLDLMAGAQVVVGQHSFGVAGMTELQAMALGRPVVMRAPGAPVIDSTVQTLPERVRWALNHPQEAARTARRARDWCLAAHAPAAVVERLDALYARLAD